MNPRSSRRALAGALVLALGVASYGTPPSAIAQAPADCSGQGAGTPEVSGPTDIAAVSANGSLSVGFNDEGTITVFRWPSPSFYDQIKYRTTDRSEPRMGALPNEGALIGAAWQKAGSDDWTFDWLRSWSVRQSFVDDDGDEILTRYRKPAVGLTIEVRDVVSSTTDVLAREVKVTRSASSKVRKVRVFAFANINPVFSKTAQSATNDWCTEENNDAGGEYVPGSDAIVHERQGTDASTGSPSGAAVAFGFSKHSEGHQVGVDIYETAGAGTSAYDDAADGKLTGDDSAVGQADAALFDEISLKKSKSGRTSVLFSAGSSRAAALGRLESTRVKTFGALARAKADWWKGWLKTAPLPKDAPASVTRLAKRALISIRQGIDADTPDFEDEGDPLPKGNLMVATIATQPPQSLDWIRNGSYINRVLDIAGHPETVEKHNLRYATLQSKAGDTMRGGGAVPPGNWHQNYYADGVVGGPISYEIDETGYGLWTLWDHFQQTKDRNYLIFANGGAVYEAIQLGAQFLSDICRDLATGLQCVANEGDNPTPSQTLKGAMLVWLGLDSAARAAREFGSTTALANADKWETRRDEVGAAIEENFTDAECECLTRDYADGGTLLWPVSFFPRGSEGAESQAKSNWDGIEAVLDGDVTSGGYEAKAVLGNSFTWRSGSNRSKLKSALEWIATIPTTNETKVLGEAWMRYPNEQGPIVTMMGQPHIANQALFYLAAIDVYGRESYSFGR